MTRNDATREPDPDRAVPPPAQEDDLETSPFVEPKFDQIDTSLPSEVDLEL